MAAGVELDLAAGLLSVFVDDEPESEEEPDDVEEPEESDEDEDSPLAPVELPEPVVRLSVR